MTTFFHNHFLSLGLAVFICLILVLILVRSNFDLAITRIRSSRWLRRNYIWLVIFFASLLILAAIILYVYQLPGLIQNTVRALQTAFETAPENDEKLRNLAYTFAALAGALTIMATIPFQLIRIWLNERSARTDEQGHITDQINKAVEGLGAEKTVKGEAGEQIVPNIAVRVGAIYALERIGLDSIRDHIQIMEILTAYIRENAPLNLSEQQPTHTVSETSDGQDAQMEHEAALRNAHAYARYAQFDPVFYDNSAWIWGRKLRTKTDIQAIASVIGRRSAEQQAVQRSDKRFGENGHILDLKNSNLQGVDFSHLNFCRALLSGSTLNGANLSFTGAENADLRWTRLKGAKIISARLNDADLSEAHFVGSDLASSYLEGTKLHESHLINSDLAFTSLKGSDFSNASLLGVGFAHAVFDEKTNLDVHTSAGSAFRVNDFSKLPDISPSFLSQAFGDGTVKLPPGLVAGEGVLGHWETEKLEPRVFYQKWRAWQQEA